MMDDWSGMVDSVVDNWSGVVDNWSGVVDSMVDWS